VVQCVAVNFSTSESQPSSVLQCVAVCCSVMQCDAVWCSVVQCVAVSCSAAAVLRSFPQSVASHLIDAAANLFVFLNVSAHLMFDAIH